MREKEKGSMLSEDSWIEREINLLYLTKHLTSIKIYSQKSISIKITKNFKTLIKIAFTRPYIKTSCLLGQGRLCDPPAV